MRLILVYAEWSRVVKGILKCPPEGLFAPADFPRKHVSISLQRNRLIVFPSDLGWMGLIGAGKVLKALTFGHTTEEAAARALGRLGNQTAGGAWNEPLVRRLKAYAAGVPVDFSDIVVGPGHLTDFQRRVLKQCRKISYGRTRTYGQLASLSGSPRAGRAVGSCMAANPIPLVIPCHRVVRSDGRVGCYSSVGGTKTKARLLAMESAPRQPERQ